MAAVLNRSIVSERRPDTDRQRSFVVHRQPGFCDDVDDSAKTVSVFGWKAAGHHAGGLDDVWTQTSGKDRVWIFPKRDTIDKCVERDLISSHVYEIVVTSDHARSRDGDHVRQIVSLIHWQIIYGFPLQGRRARRICGRQFGDGMNFDGLLDSPKGKLERDVLNFAGLQRQLDGLFLKALPRSSDHVWAGNQPLKCELSVVTALRSEWFGQQRTLKPDLDIRQ